MTDSRPATPAPAALPDLSRRDLSLDLVRVVCVLLVVVIHLLFVGVGVGADGATLVTRPLEEQSWFAAATWVGQIMPLFFVVGGFAAITGYRSHARRGGTALGFVRTRALRLAQPALPLFVFFAVVLGAAAVVGAPADIVDAAATGAGSPLWFLAAYLLTQSLAPAMIAWHERSRLTALSALAAGAVLVDSARYLTGVDEIGLLNLLFVWLLIQQFGFWYFDGWFRRRHPLVLLAIAVACYLLLVPATTVGPYHADMLANLNPPTVPLVLLGLAQACLLRILAPALTAITRLRAVQAVMFVVGSRLMTIYLWHLPVILLIAGIGLLIPGFAPPPASPPWWASRILVFLLVMAVLFAWSRVIGRFESPWDARPVPPAAVVVMGVVLAFLPPFAVMEFFLDLPIAAIGSVLLAVGVLLLIGRRSPRGTPAGGSP
ncbi:MAG: acyltransferase family protein [Leucobacter sp.]